MGLLKSSIGQKYIMGLAGLGWALFVFGHMAGNLLILYSAEAYNRYGHAIVSNKPLLYGTEVFLVLCLAAHAGLGIRLSLANKKANPDKYATSGGAAKKARLASKTMAYQGSIILFFIIYHLITFKFGPEYMVVYGGEEMRDLHRLIVEVFQSPAYVFGYLICLGLLGVHLSHGVASIFQSIGFNHPRHTPLIKKIGWLYAFVVAGGFIVQPLYVFLIH